MDVEATGRWETESLETIVMREVGRWLRLYPTDERILIAYRTGFDVAQMSRITGLKSHIVRAILRVNGQALEEWR